MNVAKKHSEQGNCPTRLRFTSLSERNLNFHFTFQGYLLFVSSFVVCEILKSTYYCHIAYECYIHTIRWNRHSILLNLWPFLLHRFHNLSLGKRRDHIRYRVSKATANHLITAAMLNYEVENQAIESRHPNATTMFDTTGNPTNQHQHSLKGDRNNMHRNPRLRWYGTSSNLVSTLE